MFVGKVIGLDIGTASIGVALSDPMRIIASPKEVIRYKNNDLDEFVAEFEKLIIKYKPSEIVCGLPLNMDGSESETTRFVRKAVELGKTKTDLPFHWVDERWTSKAAEKSIARSNVKKSMRKSKNDEVAASMILEIFLESQV